MPEGEKRTENFIPEVPGQLRQQRARKAKPLRMIRSCFWKNCWNRSWMQGSREYC